MLGNVKIPKLIHSVDSKYNGKIDVYQVGDYRRISVDNTIQSVSKNCPSVRHRVWGRIVESIKHIAPDAKNILMFGLGGATCLHLFAEDMPDTHITVVEIDEAMIEVAKQFFDFDSLTNTTLIHADALRVISEPEKFDLHQGTFDVVLVDIYCGEDYPELGKSGTFFNGVKWFLHAGGFAVFNRIYVEHHQNNVNEFKMLVEGFFKDVNTVTIAGRTNSDNLLIYGVA